MHKTDAVVRIVVRSLVLTVMALTLVWFSRGLAEMMSPYQAEAAVRQLADDNATYATARALSTFNLTTVMGVVLTISVLVVWCVSGWQIYKLTDPPKEKVVDSTKGRKR